MITLLSGTNRKNSLTYQFSSIYFDLLKEKTKDCQFYDLCCLPDVLLNPGEDFYKNRPKELQHIQDKYFTNAEKLIFIVPEYNGSFPGILKLLIDGMDPKLAFYGKKAAITGIATGRAGNLRGIDHLASILQHMGTTVLPYLLPVSRAHQEITEEKKFGELTEKVITRQIREFVEF